MAKLELTRSAEDYLRRKVDEWYEEAQDKRDEWYNRCLDSLNWEYERKMRDADEDEEDEVESWYNSKVRDLDYDYRQVDSRIDSEKNSIDNFINNSVIDRYYDNKSYVVDCIIQSLPNVYRVHNSVVEADDLMFSISRIKQFENKFIIYTLDKDLFQAIDSTTFISNHYSNGHFTLLDDASDYYKKHFRDLEPSQIPYYRACIGDRSDNLPPIQDRFPKKVAYCFAKYCVKSDEIVTICQSASDSILNRFNKSSTIIYNSIEK